MTNTLPSPFLQLSSIRTSLLLMQRTKKFPSDHEIEHMLESLGEIAEMMKSAPPHVVETRHMLQSLRQHRPHKLALPLPLPPINTTH